ncbi:hypothetical protein N0V85_000347 [Neurospora sp. IMI 360204]|nr:hypothetical protein N0V85_000347 [Neurospora sp. IMI 360204]
MHSSMGSESAPSESWTTIEFHTSRHTKFRSPEYNDDNESSAQVASISSASYNTDLASENTQGDNVTGTLEIPYRGRSHGYSTETASSDQTFFAEEALKQEGTVATVPPVTANHSLPKGLSLTESVLKRHREAMAQSYAGNMNSWVDGTPFVGPLAIPEVSGNPSTTKPPKSKHSISSSIASDWVDATPSSPELVGCGGRFDELDGRHRRYSTLVLEGPMPHSD